MRQGVHRTLKGYEKRARQIASTRGLVGQSRRAIGVHPWRKLRRGRTLVFDFELARHQNHTLSGRVAVSRQLEFRGHPQEDVGVRACGIAVQNGYLTTLRKDRWAWPPL